MKKIALACNYKPEGADPSTGDRYLEWDSPDTIDAIRSALAKDGDVVVIEGDERASERFRAERPDVVFNMAEGIRGVGREAYVPTILEALGIPYTGSDPLTLAICLDKSRTKEILAFHRVPTAPFAVVDDPDDIRPPGNLPFVVKPLHEGSSMGVFDSSLVRDAASLEREVRRVVGDYREPALIEEFLPGREFTVAVLGNGPDARTLPIVEIDLGVLPAGKSPLYSYEAKWVWDRPEAPLRIFHCPADVAPDLERKIVAATLAAYRALRCRDWCRIDIRLDARGEPNVIELNPIPGILPNPDDNSCFPKAARAAGLGYEALVRTVLRTALDRLGMR
ncbi:MAG: D-alanine--D-alanine ligase [Planctomycetes bacterium]|nr:D-alanine--D-alanine ligase [Planctomycetota bacterium]